tara:strand:- start:214 stop:1362 length:1149 start_codon:yes stop_codon:yes gene_type:complete
MKVIDILHVASFNGNIGDNANHKGFYRKIKETLPDEYIINIKEFEIREVFWKNKAFDAKFVEYANEFDLIIFGGGNYFELWVDSSPTGTSISIEPSIFMNITPPVIFNALGIDPAQGASTLSIDKFESFLDAIESKGDCILSCRNDGSIAALKEYVDKKYHSRFYHVPDAGFFTTVADIEHIEIVKGKKNIAIQLAGDMLETRFNIKDGSISYNYFLKSMATYIQSLIADYDANIILIPHIYSDLKIIADLLMIISDKERRNSLKVAPYLTGERGQDYIFGIYKECDLTIGMRFHANVCSIGLKTPTIGLVNYRQIKELYNELSLSQYGVSVNSEFSEELILLSKSLLEGDTESIYDSTLSSLNAQQRPYFESIKNLILRSL